MCSTSTLRQDHLVPAVWTDGDLLAEVNVIPIVWELDPPICNRIPDPLPLGVA
jgi:hypothetical protein